jgi:hypothetical protein
MRLHPSAVKRLLKIYDTYGGYREETKLRQELEAFELTVYTRQSGGQEEVLVPTDEYNQALRG